MVVSGSIAIPWFNGGLFDDLAVRDLMTAARLDWKAIDPTIFGTLFESGLDDKRRAEMASLFDAPDPEERAQARLFAASTANREPDPVHDSEAKARPKIIEPVARLGHELVFSADVRARARRSSSLPDFRLVRSHCHDAAAPPRPAR